MDFEYDAKTTSMIGKLEAFMNEVVYPAEPLAHEQMQAAIKEDSWSPPAVLEDLKAEARDHTFEAAWLKVMDHLHDQISDRRERRRHRLDERHRPRKAGR